ncbi:MAG: hypothetical protein ACUVRO_11680, partial [Armatimonadota bacterium]
MGRLALVVPSFPRLSETFIASKFLCLLDRGWDVHIVCGATDPDEWRRFPDLIRRTDVRRRVHCSWPSRPRWVAGVLTPAAFTVCLTRQCRATARYLFRGMRWFGLDTLRRFYLDQQLIALRPDIIHFEFGALAVGRTYIKELLGCRLVVSFRGYDLNFSGLEDREFYSEVWQT